MQFRIVGHHQHQAIVEGVKFTCVRTATATDAGLSVRWAAYRNEVILKPDCRTLNEAKNVCRSAASIRASN